MTDELLLPNTSYITNTYDNMARLMGTWLKDSSYPKKSRFPPIQELTVTNGSAFNCTYEHQSYS